MTTATAIISAAAALVAVLISLTTLSPRARRVKRLAEHVAIYKDLPEGDLREEYREAVLRAMRRVQSDDADQSGFEVVMSYCMRVVLLSAAVSLLATAGQVAIDAPVVFASTDALLLGALEALTVAGTLVLLVTTTAMVIAVAWQVWARYRASRAAKRRSPDSLPAA